MNKQIPLELKEVDQDIREYFLENIESRYIPGFPIKIQISRYLKTLAKQK